LMCECDSKKKIYKLWPFFFRLLFYVVKFSALKIQTFTKNMIFDDLFFVKKSCGREKFRII
jgi:hypothetical protein